MILHLLAILLLIWILYLKWNNRHLQKLSVQLKSRLRGFPLIGHAYIFFGNAEDRMKSFQQTGREAISSGGATALWQLNRLYIMIADPEVAEIVLKTCLEKDDTYNVFQLVTGDGSIFSSVSKWRPRRKFLAPTFNMKNLNRFVDVFSAQSCIMVDKMKNVLGNGPAAMWTTLSTYTMDAVCETTLGFKANAQTNPSQPIVVAFYEMFRIAAACMCQPLLHTYFIIFKNVPQYQILKKYKTLVYEFVDKIIVQKQRDQDGQQNPNKERMKYFVELMIESEMDMSDMAIREECLVILGAGTDTSAVSLGYTLLMLARHPDVQEKVYRELKALFGDCDRPVLADDLHRLKYMDAVIKETMRLYPPVPIIARKIDKTVKLPSGVTLLSGCGAVINIWAIHRNHNYWGNDAELFRPERFLESAPVHPAAFMPFSYGPRNCLGFQYAMMSNKTVLANLLKKYRLVPASQDGLNKPLRVRFDIMMRHVDDYCVGIEDRK